MRLSKCICTFCSKQFERYSPPCKNQPRYYCSQTCQRKSKRTGQWKKCKVCCKYFWNIPSQHKQHTCSRQCGGIFRSNRITKTCKQCGSKYTTRPEQSTSRFCSRCYYSHATARLFLLKCKMCGKTFSRKDKKFCSRDCYEKSMQRFFNGMEFKKQIINSRRMEWYVVVSVLVKWSQSERRTKRFYTTKRKSVLVAEQLIGRSLTPSESRDLVFMDGNTLNCNPANLLIRRTCFLWQCKTCSKVIRESPSRAIRRKGTRCKNCLNTHGFKPVYD